MVNIKKILIIMLCLVIIAPLLNACSFFEKDSEYQNSEYDMSLLLDTDAKKLHGEMSINYYCRNKGLSELSLQIYANAYRDIIVNDKNIEDAYPKGKISYGGITINGLTSSSHKIQSYTIAGEDMTILRVKLEKGLKNNELLSLSINFTVDIPKINHRLGYNNYTYNLANFYPIMCVYENGAFLEYEHSKIGDPFYSEISNYNVSMTLPKNYVLAHSGVCEEVTENEDATKTYLIKGENIRDFAMSASPYYILRTEMLNDIKIQYYYIKEDDAVARIQHIKSVLTAFNGFFGDYPYTVITVVKTPFAFGGMEYPQLVYIADNLNDADTDMVIAHELAHQWWYGLVGNDQIRHAWLDEALAEFSAYHYYRVHENIKYKMYFNSSYDTYVRYSSITGLTGENAKMNDLLYDYDDYRYSANVYIKGLLMLTSLYEIKGDALILALKQYALENRYQIATPEIFIRSLTRSLNTQLYSYFNAWLEGKVILL